MAWRDPLLPHQHPAFVVSRPPKKHFTKLLVAPVVVAKPRPAPVVEEPDEAEPEPLPPPPVPPQPESILCFGRTPLLRETVRIIGCDNGVGLTRDGAIIERAFREAGWDVSFLGPTAPDGSLPFVTLNIHLEIFALRLMDTALENIVIPNAEGWNDSWTEALQHPTAKVWVKTHDAARIFVELGARVTTLGFRSEDHFDASEERERAFLHVSGGSAHKSTHALIEAWREGWPLLTIVSAPESVERMKVPSNVLVMGRITDEALRKMQNQHVFHIYPSRYEGFGHALWEGLSCGAIVFATDCPPFNEYTDTFRLLTTKKKSVVINGIATGYEVDKKAIASAVAWATKLSDVELDECQHTSRVAWARATTAFDARIRELVTAAAELG